MKHIVVHPSERRDPADTMAVHVADLAVREYGSGRYYHAGGAIIRAAQRMAERAQASGRELPLTVDTAAALVGELLAEIYATEERSAA
jgi:hypothetical protein